jgi:S-formylglutathione hydrolase FrmB
MESVMGRGNSYLTSSGQWGGWNAIYGPRDENGLPAPVWDQDSGIIDKSVADKWKKYDLTQYITDNWDTLSAKINGKLFFWMGDMDGFYLNNGLRSFEDAVQKLNDPVSRVVFEFLPETGHCDFEKIDMRKKIINEMMIRFEATN